MTAAGFTRMREEPYEWVKTAAGTIPQNRYRHRSHELIASYGRRDARGKVRRLFRPRLDNKMPAPTPASRRAHGQPAAILERLIRAGTYAGELVCDPFAASGH